VHIKSLRIITIILYGPCSRLLHSTWMVFTFHFRGRFSIQNTPPGV